MNAKIEEPCKLDPESDRRKHIDSCHPMHLLTSGNQFLILIKSRRRCVVTCVWHLVDSSNSIGYILFPIWKQSLSNLSKLNSFPHRIDPYRPNESPSTQLAFPTNESD